MSLYVGLYETPTTMGLDQASNRNSTLGCRCINYWSGDILGIDARWALLGALLLSPKDVLRGWAFPVRCLGWNVNYYGTRPGQ